MHKTGSSLSSAHIARLWILGLCTALGACGGETNSSPAGPTGGEGGFQTGAGGGHGGSGGDPGHGGSGGNGGTEDPGPEQLPFPPLPLSTRGRYIVDAAGNRFKLASVNWYGASDALQVVGGLDVAPLADIVAAMRALGFNSVRLPFSNLMLHDANPVAPDAVAANPELTGLTPLEVYDRVVTELTRQGIGVIVNNHTTHPMWCCNFDSDGLWYTSDYSEDQWVEDWAMVARRYRDNPRVIGADLRNEVRPESGTLPQFPNWAASPNDWRVAAERAGDRVLDENPDLLIVVEGINFGIPVLQSRPHLQPVAADPIRLKVPHKLVYAAHNYGYIGPSETSGPKYGEMEWPQFQQQVFNEWGYVALNETRSYTAPVWVSEFGDSINQDHQMWFQNLVRYLGEGDFDSAYWGLNPGPKASGDDEPYALLEHDWKTPLEDWRIPLLRSIQAPRRGPGVEPDWNARPENHLEVLLFSDWDTNRSKNRDDWAPGTYKATCGDAARVVGVTTGLRALQRYAHTALCSDFSLAAPSARGAALLSNGGDVGSVNVHTAGQDWASGYLKIECASNEAVVGLSQTRNTLSYSIAGVLCSPGPAYGTTAGGCYSVLTDGADDRRSQTGGDWDPEHSKGQCGDGDYVAGISLSSTMIHSLLCCPG